MDYLIPFHTVDGLLEKEPPGNRLTYCPGYCGDKKLQCQRYAMMLLDIAKGHIALEGAETALIQARYLTSGTCKGNIYFVPLETT